MSDETVAVTDVQDALDGIPNDRMVTDVKLSNDDVSVDTRPTPNAYLVASNEPYGFKIPLDADFAVRSAAHDDVAATSDGYVFGWNPEDDVKSDGKTTGNRYFADEYESYSWVPVGALSIELAE
jgi:hypothetical protein